jgi:hypothetical protein
MMSWVEVHVFFNPKLESCLIQTSHVSKSGISPHSQACTQCLNFLKTNKVKKMVDIDVWVDSVSLQHCFTVAKMLG